MTDFVVDIYTDKVLVNGVRVSSLKEVPPFARRYCRHLLRKK